MSDKRKRQLKRDLENVMVRGALVHAMRHLKDAAKLINHAVQRLAKVKP